VKKAVLRGFAVVALAFALTSGVMFWVPLIATELGYDSYDFYPYGYGDYYPTLKNLKDKSPAEQRPFLDSLFEELKDKDPADLLRFQAAADDVCEDGSLACSGLPPAKVQRLISAILAQRQNERENNNAVTARYAMWISGGSLFVAFLALLISFLKHRRETVEAR